jgi:hypothetical protein
VLRLTLFFFGAAKDIPEAAKMVTAGAACLDLICKLAANPRPDCNGYVPWGHGTKRRNALGRHGES